MEAEEERAATYHRTLSPTLITKPGTLSNIWPLIVFFTFDIKKSVKRRVTQKKKKRRARGEERRDER